MLGIISAGGFQISPSMAPVWFLSIGGACHRRNSYAPLIGWNSFAYQSLRRGGGCRGGARGPRLPLIFRPNWGPKDQKKVFFTPPRPPPLFQGLYDRPPPLSESLDSPLHRGFTVNSHLSMCDTKCFRYWAETKLKWETSLFTNIVLLFKFGTSETKESFVARTNALLVASYQ